VITLDPDRAISLRQGIYDDGTRWCDYFYEWPSLDEDSVLTEGQRHAWFTLDEALGLADLSGYARTDLCLFRDRLTR
jgi:hypothetical protein